MRYLIVDVDYDSYTVHGSCDTEERAEQVLAQLKRTDPRRFQCSSIEEVPDLTSEVHVVWSVRNNLFGVGSTQPYSERLSGIVLPTTVTRRSYGGGFRYTAEGTNPEECEAGVRAAIAGEIEWPEES
jgi:hypothetical protein